MAYCVSEKHRRCGVNELAQANYAPSIEAATLGFEAVTTRSSVVRTNH